MLSLKSGLPIAIINGDKDKKIYYKEASKDANPEIDTSELQKVKILKGYYDRNEKLSNNDKQTLLDAYKSSRTLENAKLNKLLEQGKEYIEKSLKRYLHYTDKTELFPIITDPSFRLFCSGTSGSGKTWFVSELVKVNKPKKEGGVFMFSPFDSDPSIKIKNLIHLRLETFKDDFGKEFEIEDIPEGSICIFDDIDTYNKRYRNLYLDARDALMERGRHLNVSTINISHNPLQGVKSKVTLRESMYYVFFPKYNPRDAKTLLKSYTSITKDAMNEILNTDSRWVFLRKSVPQYYVTQKEIGLL
jgi:hypothetical protein